MPTKLKCVAEFPLLSYEWQDMAAPEGLTSQQADQEVVFRVKRGPVPSKLCPFSRSKSGFQATQQMWRKYPSGHALTCCACVREVWCVCCQTFIKNRNVRREKWGRRENTNAFFFAPTQGNHSFTGNNKIRFHWMCSCERVLVRTQKAWEHVWLHLADSFGNRALGVHLCERCGGQGSPCSLGF